MAVISTEAFAFLAYFSYAIYASMVPQLTLAKVCSSIYNTTVCNSLSAGSFKHEEKQVYDKVTQWNTICFALIFGPSLLTIMILGALSNLVSKKTLLLLSPSLRTIQNIILMLSSRFMNSSMIFVAFAASLTSVFADVHGDLVLSYAYMAEVTEANGNRTARMAVLGALMFIGQGLGSFLSGILLTNYGFMVAFSLSLASSVANFIFVAFILPDTKSTSIRLEKEAPISVVSSLCKHLKLSCMDTIKFFKKYLFSWKNKHVSLLILSATMASSPMAGEDVLLVLFFKHRPLNLSPNQIGEIMLALQCICGLGAIVLVIASAKGLRPSDLVVTLIGFISQLTTFLAVGLSRDLRSLVGIATPLAIAFSLPSSAIRSMMTKAEEPSEQPTALSCIQFACISIWLLITLCSNKLFRQTATFFPGLSVVLFSLFGIVGIIATLAVFCSTAQTSQRHNGYEMVEQLESDRRE